MCYELIEIGDNVVISYGVYFACHGKNQGHFPIVIEDNAYIGMRASIITKHKFFRGGDYWQKFYCWFLRSCEQGRAYGVYCGWRSMQNYKEMMRY